MEPEFQQGIHELACTGINITAFHGATDDLPYPANQAMPDIKEDKDQKHTDRE